MTYLYKQILSCLLIQTYKEHYPCDNIYIYFIHKSNIRLQNHKKQSNILILHTQIQYTQDIKRKKKTLRREICYNLLFYIRGLKI